MLMPSPSENANQHSPRRTAEKFGKDPYDFSLVLGGPVFQLWRRLHLSGDQLELLHRRVIAIVLVAWLPLLILSSVGSPGGGTGYLGFVRDVEVQFRFLIALPVLIFAELIVHNRIRYTVRRFVERRIVRPEELPRFGRAIESANRLRNSIPLEIALVVLVYTLGLWLWSSRVSIQSPTWYAMPGGRWHLTIAGIWYVFVSIPIVQFILLRWYLRFFIWYRFLWRVSRIDLNLITTHPDRCAGLAFLGWSAYAFGTVLFAQGAMLAGIVADRVLYAKESLTSFKLQIGGFIVFFVLAIFGPLLAFTPQMARAKRKGWAIYGQLAQNYVADFEQKWIPGDEATKKDLLGTSDIQSLADLANSYSIVDKMHLVPFGLPDVTRLAAATAAPFLPLLFTAFSPEELIMRLIKVLF
jgi:hypothetical protein